jgi:hypothetical protein
MLKLTRLVSCVVLAVAACGRPAAAEVIRFQFDFTVSQVSGSSSTTPAAPEIANLFAPGSTGSLLLSWEDTATPFDRGGGLYQYHRALRSVGIRSANYSSDVRLSDYNYLFQHTSQSRFSGYGDLFGGAQVGGLGFSPFYFEFSTDVPSGTLPGTSLPDALPSSPANSYFQLSFGAGPSEQPQIVRGQLERVASVPEPGTALLIAMGLAGAALRARRRR